MTVPLASIHTILAMNIFPVRYLDFFQMNRTSQHHKIYDLLNMIAMCITKKNNPLLPLRELIAKVTHRS